MPVQVTGLVPHNRSTLVAPRPGTEFDIAGIREFAQVHEAAGFDRVLIANAATMPDSMAIGNFVTHETRRLGVMLAHRPGFIAPTMAARMLATLDRLSDGRTAVHIIAGASDVELQADGDFLTKEARYRRAAEYIEIMRRVWASAEPFDHQGEFYHLQGASSLVRPESGAIHVFWGGESDIAIELGGHHADTYAILGDTLAGAGNLAERAHAAAAGHGRTIEVLMTLVIVLGETEDQAWDRAGSILTQVKAQKATDFDDHSDRFRNAEGKHASRGFDRILKRSLEGDRLDKCLWTGMNKAMGGRGNNTTLVGTPEQVVDSLCDYYRLGIRRFLLRGYDIMADAAAIGSEVIPAFKARAEAIDSDNASRDGGVA